MSWQEVVDFPEYEIWTEFPYQIRKKSNKRIIKECVDKSTGYIVFNLNNKKCYKHRIVAMQWIENPDNYKYVDHINRVKTDFRIENLHWCSHKMNMNNLPNQNFVDEISGDCIVVDKYNNHEFEFLYFDPENDTFYVYNGINYVVKPRYQNKFGYWFVCVCDKNNKSRSISYAKFKKQYGLI